MFSIKLDQQTNRFLNKIFLFSCRFANSLAYYGLSLNTGTLPGNPFLMLFVTGLVEFPSYIATSFLMDRTGRRSLISTFMIVGGLACIVSAFISQGQVRKVIDCLVSFVGFALIQTYDMSFWFAETVAGSNAVITIVMFGKFFIAGSFAIIYNYTAELFPTVVRNTALGVGSMCARLSGALTPLISLLVSVNAIQNLIGCSEKGFSSCDPEYRKKI